MRWGRLPDQRNLTEERTLASLRDSNGDSWERTRIYLWGIRIFRYCQRCADDQDVLYNSVDQVVCVKSGSMNRRYENRLGDMGLMTYTQIGATLQPPWPVAHTIEYGI